MKHVSQWGPTNPWHNDDLAPGICAPLVHATQIVRVIISKTYLDWTLVFKVTHKSHNCTALCIFLTLQFLELPLPAFGSPGTIVFRLIMGLSVVGQLRKRSDSATVWTMRSLNPGGKKGLLSPPKLSHLLYGPPCLPSKWLPEVIWSGWGAQFTFPSSAAVRK